ncbi:serine/threonine-protein kinase Nek3 isoform X2 [Pundamilia nyererei]|uniref:Serine/threonine-protein kinase Nek3 isoform X2 n=1 Tax=Pundamilia nyererei TaxID=303518 RepID=A0A9Y3VMR2_9CICH|nr:serine/threonine-protein kinase Nek3 [Maylandia zebra]XP_005736028.1 PREDICTED: serine/threonine-protein kinase Nek3 isoform X2 [Pundamilia nyererei]
MWRRSMEKYSLVKVIGEGSFGRAVLVRCKSSQEKYVVKEIQLPKNQSKLENSRREAILLSRMKHPNIVAFREAFEADELLWIVMEYCSGGDLLQRIKQQKSNQFSVDNILKWFAEMCAGAKHIHDQRVLHRDLKSKNIFLTDNGTVKLGDFGSACILNSSKAYAHAYVGTPYYVAPEIWDNKPYNNKSDVWSLGCVLYELCTLRHPFQASSWKSLILKVCRGAYPPLPSHLPYELQYLVKQMFKTNPKDRPSLHTILTSHRVSKLLRTHLPSQGKSASEREEQARHTGRWNREEGKNVARLLGEKSLIKTSTSEGMDLSKSCFESRDPAPRKQWSTEPSDTVLQVLANASLVSSDSVTSTGWTFTSSTHEGEPEDSRQRRRWERNPPERLLSLLEKAQLSKASSTFIINRGEDPLLGPLSHPQGDDTDGPEQELVIDEDRLQPRSDDEDTDFEEESPCDWMDEAEKIFLEH